MGALDAHASMSTQARNSEKLREGLLDILMEHTGLCDRMRARERG